MAARPMVSVISLETGAPAEQTALPAVFSAPIRHARCFVTSCSMCSCE